ncbi:hypothetical protein BTHI11S_01697 [Bosea thiooxidans]
MLEADLLGDADQAGIQPSRAGGASRPKYPRRRRSPRPSGGSRARCRPSSAPRAADGQGRGPVRQARCRSSFRPWPDRPGAADRRWHRRSPALRLRAPRRDRDSRPRAPPRSAQHLRLVRRIELPGGGSVQHGMGVDRRDGGDVGRRGVADGRRGHGVIIARVGRRTKRSNDRAKKSPGREAGALMLRSELVALTRGCRAARAGTGTC